MLFLSVATWAHAACPASVVQLREELKEAQFRYEALDVPGFQAQAETAFADAACLSEPAPSGVVARLYLVLALDAWLDRNPDAVLSAFRGMAVADPELALPESMAPAGGRLRALFDISRDAFAGARVTAPAAPGATWLADGTLAQGGVLPADRAVFVQRVEADGRVTRGWLFPRGAEAAALGGDSAPASLGPPPPVAPAVAAASLSSDAAPPPPDAPPPSVSATLPAPGRHGLTSPSGLMMTGAGAMTVLTCVGALVARAADSDFTNAGYRQETDGYVVANRAWGTTAIVSSVAAAGLVGASVVVKRW